MLIGYKGLPHTREEVNNQNFVQRWTKLVYPTHARRDYANRISHLENTTFTPCIGRIPFPFMFTDHFPHVPATWGYFLVVRQLS